MKKTMINVSKVEVSKTPNGCVIFTVTADEMKFELSMKVRNLGKYYKDNNDAAAVEAWLVIDGKDYDANFYPYIGCKYPRIENIDLDITYFVSVGSLELCSAVEQECKRACGYELPEDRRVFVDQFAEDTNEIELAEDEIENELSIESILDALANDPTALSMLGRYAVAGIKEKERMTSYLKAVILDK